MPGVLRAVPSGKTNLLNPTITSWDRMPTWNLVFDIDFTLTGDLPSLRKLGQKLERLQQADQIGRVVKKIDEASHNLIDRKICKDNKDDIVVILKDWLNNNQVDVIITTGGTGLTGRDITPEALDDIADKYIPGFGEIFRYLSFKTIGTSTIQSRACAVLAKGKYVFALPGSSGGVTDAWEGILKHQLDVNHKPCNFVELIPRLKEK